MMWVDQGTLWAVGVVAVVVAGLVLGLVARFASKLADVLAGAIGDRVVAAIGDRLQERWREDLEIQLAPIRQELNTNGGDSIKDRVLTISLQVEDLQKAVEQSLTGGR